MPIREVKILLYIIVLFLFFIFRADANIFINEIQISDTDDRFIELYNSSDSIVDLTDWYIQRKTATGIDFGSLVSKTYFNGKSIKASSYFVISKGDFGDIIFPNLTLTESNSIQIKNSKQEVVDIIGWGDSPDCNSVCDNNPITGKSLQRLPGGDWVIANPTIGKNNSSNSFVDETEEDKDQYEDENIVLKKENTKEILPLKISTKISSPKIITVGDPFSFSSKTTDNRGKTYYVGRFIWNFGDGNKIEVEDSGPFEYVYEYEGEYILHLMYFDNDFAENPEATDKIKIKVIPPSIYINSVGDNINPYVELKNKSKDDIDISGWSIVTGYRIFSFPYGTLIPSGQTIKLHKRVTGFDEYDIEYLIIQNPRGDIVSTYPASSNFKVGKVLDSQKVIVDKPKEENKEDIKKEEIINLNNLEASAIKQGKEINIYIIGLVSVIIIGILGVLFLRKKYEFQKDDLDENVSIDDIKIIE